MEDIRQEWPYDSSDRAWIIAYDEDGNVMEEFQIDQGTHSIYF